MLKVTFDDKFIYFNGQVDGYEISSFTNYDEQLYNELIKHKWNCYTDKTTGEIGAVRSSRKIGDETMYLSQFVYNYFSSELYAEASKLGYTVKNLNDDKWNCTFENLYISLELTTTYNGATLSKVLKENRDYICARIVQISSNNTMQVQVKFNKDSVLRKVLLNGKQVEKINLLYKNDYNTVLNDIDFIFTNVLDIYIPSKKVKQDGDSIEINTIIENCKYNDIKVDYEMDSQELYLTADECETIRKVGYIFKVINGKLNAITVNEMALYNKNVTENNDSESGIIGTWDLK